MMGGGGFMSHMMNSVRGNKSLLRKKRLFDREKDFTIRKKAFKRGVSGKLLDKKVDKKELEKIKNEIRKDIRNQNRKRFIVHLTIVLAAIVISLLLVQVIYKSELNYNRLQKEKNLSYKKQQFKYYVDDAKMWHKKGSYNNAITQYKEALQLFPNNVEVRNNLKELYSIKCITDFKYCEELKNIP